MIVVSIKALRKEAGRLLGTHVTRQVTLDLRFASYADTNATADQLFETTVTFVSKRFAFLLPLRSRINHTYTFQENVLQLRLAMTYSRPQFRVGP